MNRLNRYPPVGSIDIGAALLRCCAVLVVCGLLAGCALPGFGEVEPEFATVEPAPAEPATPPAADDPPADAPDAPADTPDAPADTDPTDESAAFPTPAPAELPTGPGGNLIMTLGAQDPPSLDPALVGDVLSAFVVRQLFTGLVRLDNQLEVQPDLAWRWDLSDDGRTYTFTLREDARFADGSPLTTEDVRYSFERATDPALGVGRVLPAATYLTDIVGVREKLAGEAETISGLEVLDEQTIALTIDQPKSYFLAKLAHPTSFIVDRQAVEQGGAGWYEQPNGSGPFAIETWRSNAVMVLRRNVNFYRDLAELDRVTFLMGANASNPLVLYEQGEIDVTGVPSFALDRVQDESNPLSQELVSVPQLSITYIGMNVELPPFDDPYVRQAFSLMLDRDKIANVSLYGSVVPARGVLPPGMPGYSPDLPAPEVDLERARNLLEESRYGGAENLPPIAAYGGGWTSTLAEIGETMGITIEVRGYENFGAFLSALDENQFPLYSAGWVADYPDPENFLGLLFGGGSPENHTLYDNPEVNALLEEAAIETDDEARWELYREAERLIMADAPFIPIYHNVDHTLIKPYVRGLEVTPMGMLDLSNVELVR